MGQSACATRLGHRKNPPGKSRTMGWLGLLALLVALSGVICQDEDDAKSHEAKLCEDKSSGELFRLKSGSDSCRDVIQCTAAGLQAIRCPPGLAFDLEKQTCDWKWAVKNCDKLTKEKKVKPLLSTDEPLCENNKLACGDSICISKDLFCDGKKDCTDGSDENACDIDNDPNCERVPQMVTITFDDAINNNNIDLYDEIFRGRRNPNGCDIKATFFVSHKYTNYSAVQNMHRMGHEIAAHSITHKDDESYWTDASTDDWAREMSGTRLIIDKFANITDNSVVGLRAPYLRVGGNRQFTMMEEQAFLYDSSITAPLRNPPLWPYTMYFKMPHRCHGNLQNCPTRSHAVWEMVMNELDRREDPTIDEDIAGCAMVDSCSNILSGDQFYNFLTHNFYRHFDQNRAPLGLFFHAAWLKNNPEFLDAFLYWVDEVLESHPVAYFISMTQVIQWIQNPVSVDSALTFEPWREKCSQEPRQACVAASRCKLSTKELPGEALHLHTCVRCPNNYPWLSDPTGDGFF